MEKVQVRGVVERNMEFAVQRQYYFSMITARVIRVGKDIHILLTGGGRPHIGCTVLAVPRLSFSHGIDEANISSTASVLNLPGHTDEKLCRYIAEYVAEKKRTVTVCCGGVYSIGSTPEQSEELFFVIKEIAREISQTNF